MGALLAASLLGCVLLTRSNPVWAFYLLPTRAWELLAGSVLALGRAGRPEGPWLRGQGWALLGLGLIAASLAWIDEGAGFPGYAAALPVLGTVLVLAADRGPSGLAERVLSWKPLTLVGRLSYSLYLWHWPVFSLVDYSLYLTPTPLRLALKVGLSLLAATATYFCIESPGRVFLNQASHRRLAFGVLAGFLLVLVPLGLGVYHDNYYINPTLGDVAHGGMVFNRHGAKGALVLLGDSNGSMYGRMLRDVSVRAGYELNCLSVAGGDPLPDPRGDYDAIWPDDTSLWPDTLAIVKAGRPEAVVLVCCWAEKLERDPGRLARAVRALKPYTKRIVLISEPPILPGSANREAMRGGSRPPFFEDPVELRARLAANQIVKGLADGQVAVLDIDHYFVGPGGSIKIFGPTGTRYFNDDGNHLSDYGADLVRPDLLKALDSIQRP